MVVHGAIGVSMTEVPVDPSLGDPGSAESVCLEQAGDRQAGEVRDYTVIAAAIQSRKSGRVVNLDCAKARKMSIGVLQ